MKKNENKVGGIFAVIIGIIFLIIGIKNIINLKDNKDKYLETMATITYLNVYESPNGEINSEVRVEYKVNGRVYESELNDYSKSFYNGKEIKIYYHKDNPSKIISPKAPIHYILFIVIGIIVTLMGVRISREGIGE